MSGKSMSAVRIAVALVAIGLVHRAEASPSFGVATQVQGGAQGAGAGASYTTRDGGGSGDSTTPSNNSITNASDTRSTSTTPGLTTAFSQTQQSADHNGEPPFTLSSSDYARASLDEGTLRASTSSTSGYSSFANALLFDTLTFNIPGATDSTTTTIKVRFGVEGTATDPALGSRLGIIELAVGGLGSFPFNDPFPSFSNTVSAEWQWAGGNDMSQQSAANSTLSWNVIADTATNYEVEGTVTLTGAHPVLGLASELQLDAGATALFQTSTQDFTHTAAVSLDLAPGITYTSSSGVFLTAPAAAVPLPAAAWGGMGLLGLLGAVRSGRRRAVA